MKLVIGSDHGGFEVKEALKRVFAQRKMEVADVGCASKEPVDYPVIAEAVGLAITDGRADRGILVCTTGVGMSVAVNRFPAVRAALCDGREVARISREHNASNVLVLSGKLGALDAELGLLNALFMFFGIFGAGVAHAASSRLGEKRVLFLSMLGSAAFACVLTPIVPNLFMLYICQAAGGFLLSLLSTLTLGLVIRDVEMRYRSSVMGFYQAMYGFGMFLGPVVTGALRDLFGTLPAYISAAALCVAAALFSLHALKKPEKTLDKAQKI